jgi:uncharacterized protein YciI
MLFFIYSVDKPGHAHVRTATRPRHLEYLKDFVDRIVIGGPTLDEAGETSTASMVIIDLADRKAAEAFAAGDPYAKANLFQSVTISRWRKVFPA